MKLAVVTARGGSKRIPRKNVRLFRGKPMIQWPLEAALKSSLFDEVMVSTDDEEIAEIAVSLGASVPFLRTEETSNDTSTTSDVLKEVLEAYSRLDETFDLTCCLYGAAPFVTAEVLQNSHDVLVKSAFDVLMPVCSFGYPIWRSLSRDSVGRVMLNWPENLNKRSQDLPPAYHDVGQFYWFRTQAFLRDGVLLGRNTGSIVLPEGQVQDIDTEEDWLMAEMKHKRAFG
jgi:N-acylneuraminate cytidylyltransferase